MYHKYNDALEEYAQKNFNLHMYIIGDITEWGVGDEENYKKVLTRLTMMMLTILTEKLIPLSFTNSSSHAQSCSQFGLQSFSI